MLDVLLDPGVVASAVRSLIPMLLAAMGGLVCERAGVFQISLEGLMLTGAFGGVAGSYFTGHWLGGIVVAVISGVTLSLVLAFGAVTRKANAIVLGIAINLFALGLTSFLMPELFGVRGVFRDPGIIALPKYSIPLLSDIPVIGIALFSGTFLHYVALIAVPIVGIWLFHTRSGLRLRGVGEYAMAAESLGTSSVVYKYAAVLFSGAMAGLAGAQLSLGNVVQFSDNMTAGRGWIAVVAVLFGLAHPWGVLGASLLFGFSEAL